MNSLCFKTGRQWRSTGLHGSSGILEARRHF